MNAAVRIRRPQRPPLRWREIEARYRAQVQGAPVRQPEPPPAMWSGLRPDGARVLLCDFHLMRAPDKVSDVLPASGLCARCTEPVLLSRHAVERWQRRVRPGKAEQAGAGILDFVGDCYTADAPPAWMRTPAPEGVEILLNDRRPHVALIKRVGSGRAVIVTVLTPEGA